MLLSFRSSAPDFVPLGMEMEIDIPNGRREGILRVNGNDIPLTPVAPNTYGKGLPYAPVDWPEPGDIWGWKVGKRVASSGHFLDRYLYLPPRLSREDNPSCSRRHAFASKLAVERFVRTAFPHADIKAFFASFSWKIPSGIPLAVNGNVEGCAPFFAPTEGMEEDPESDSQSEGVRCKARNETCNSLLVQEGNSSLIASPCDICCSEPRFCRHCCCILCSKPVKSDVGGYSYIKCEAKVIDGNVCGHIAHLNCARRCYLAGTVGGIIGLDAEYCCRRCDARMDLVPHVTNFLNIVESVNSRDDIEKILDLGVCILQGSQRSSAQGLLRRFTLAMEKLKRGTCPEDIWKIEDSDLTISTDVSHDRNGASEIATYQEPVKPITSIAPDHQSESMKLEEEISKVLHALRKSQELEYSIAEERLYAQKNHLGNLYQQLDKERSNLSRRPHKVDPDKLLDAVLSRVDEIKRELAIFKDMKEVANGFGKTPKSILKERFGLEVDK